MGPRPGRTKTAVDRVGRGKERQVNMRFLAMANHYVFEPEFCNPASGWEKGQVEKNVQDARPRLWQPMPTFPDLTALNAWLEQRCLELWREIPHGRLAGSVADVWVDEQPALMPAPPAFDGFVEQSKRVSPTCLISFERNRYSVPCCGLTRPHQGPRSLRTLCEPARQPADLSGPAGRGGRGQHPVRTLPHHPAQYSSESGPAVVRLKPRR